MNRLLVVSFAILVGVGLHLRASAQEHGTKEDAIALVNSAVAYVHKVGPEKAFADFTNDKAAWTKKDMYVTAVDNDGNVLAHGSNPKLVGKNLIDIKDSSGKLFIKESTDTSNSAKGNGWVDYEFIHPATKKPESKSTYVQKVKQGSFNGWVSAGIYR